jgi:hypothetical protein
VKVEENFALLKVCLFMFHLKEYWYSTERHGDEVDQQKSACKDVHNNVNI